MHYFSGIAASLACLVAAASAGPIARTGSRVQLEGRQSASSAACPTSSARAKPTMYNLYPARPDDSEDAVTYIEVETAGGVNTQQAMVVQGIPASATTCTVVWVQAAPEERNFAVTGSGLTSVQQLHGFPADGAAISYSAVQPFVEDSATPQQRHADFTSWDQPQYGAANHTLGPYSCGEVMHFHLAIDTELNGEGHVHFDQDDKNGFFVEYSC